MTFPTPKIDDRRFQDLVRETLDRVPAHTPEWTNLGEGDPGVTLVELFAFLAESVIYRANRVPEAARGKFLDLLGLKLSPAIPARGLVCFDATKAEAPARIDPDTEVRAGAVPFRTLTAADAVPLESLALVKETVAPADADLEYYRMLYQAVAPLDPAVKPQMYRTRVLDGRDPVRLSSQTVDGCLWIALLLPEPFDVNRRDDLRSRAREWLRGRYLSLGISPWLEQRSQILGPSRGQGGQADPTPVLRVEIPKAGSTPSAEGLRPLAGWMARPFRGGTELHKGPDILEVQMPGTAAELDFSAWDSADPLEEGVGEFPPSLLDSRVSSRVVGWLRVVPSNSADLSLTWAGINAVWVEQSQVLENEVLGTGDGSPDQSYRLSQPGVVGGSVRIQVLPDVDRIRWTEIDDLAAAGSEVRWTDPAAPPGVPVSASRPVNVFAVDESEGVVSFGDGIRGRRPAGDSRIVASYNTTLGAAGNLPAGSIRTAPDLPPALKPSNPIPTWGGADPENVKDGSRRVANWLRHRERLVTAEDFEEIVRRVPGTDLGRVEVLPAWHPDLAKSLPGDVPGVVTLMVLPRGDARDPSRPQPDANLLASICAFLEPRRLVTTEVVVRGPDYVGIRLSVGFTVAGGFSAPVVRDRLEARLRRYLAPLRDPSAAAAGESALSYPGMENGWPLRKEVNPMELLAEAAREEGVLRVDQLLLDSDRPKSLYGTVELHGLELPWLSAISVSVGAAMSLDDLKGRIVPLDTSSVTDPSTGQTSSVRRYPLPVVPETC